MSLATNKILVTGTATNTAAAYFQTTTVSASTNGTVIPAGVYVMFPTANVTVTANNGSSVATVMANNTGGVVISDGQNVFATAASGTISVTLLATNGGLAVSGTYNS